MKAELREVLEREQHPTDHHEREHDPKREREFHASYPTGFKRREAFDSSISALSRISRAVS